MESVVIIIMLLVSFSLMLKLTYLPLAGRLTVCLICALFTGLSWEGAAGQSRNQIEDWLQNPVLMLDVAVLLTVDVFMQVSFCILSAKDISGAKMSKTGNIIRLITLWIPGILIFPTLYAILVETIFSFTGMDFAMLSWTLATAVFAVGAVTPLILRWLIPERDLILELLFMINCMIALLGVVATVNGRTAISGTNSVDWQSLAGVITLLLIGAIAGYLLFKRNNNKKILKIK